MYCGLSQNHRISLTLNGLKVIKTRWSSTIADDPYVAQSLGLGAFLSD